MNENQKDLALQIMNCPMVEEAKGSSKFACFEIVNSQKPNKAFQVPEPWNGNINAPILFLSSNPGYNPDEDTVTQEWLNSDNEKGLNHFEKRLVKENWPTGTYPAFFNYIKKITSEILARDANPQEDYCSTEIVHCKSNNEVGVACATPHCTERWLNSLLLVSKAKIVILMGGTARTYCARYLEPAVEYGQLTSKEISGRMFWFTSLYHNNARFKDVGEEKKFTLAKLIEQIRSEPDIFQ